MLIHGPTNKKNSFKTVNIPSKAGLSGQTRPIETAYALGIDDSTGCFVDIKEL